MTNTVKWNEDWKCPHKEWKNNTNLRSGYRGNQEEDWAQERLEISKSWFTFQSALPGICILNFIAFKFSLNEN